MPTVSGDGQPAGNSPSGELTSVSCPSTLDCVAVGAYDTAHGWRLLAESWNGSQWTPQPVPYPPDANPYAGASLSGVSCVSLNQCTAVGDYNNGNDIAPLVEQWNGATWTAQPPFGPTGYLSAVSCASGSACLAVGAHTIVGRNDDSFAESWDGHSWAAAPPLAGAVLSGVSCASLDDCAAVGDFESSGGFAAGQALAVHWDGTTWTIENTPTLPGSSLRSVSCISPATCVAVGADFVPPVPPLAERWDGTSWAEQSTAPIPNRGLSPSLYGISCTSSTVCIMVGNLGNSDSSYVIPLAERSS